MSEITGYTVTNPAWTDYINNRGPNPGNALIFFTEPPAPGTWLWSYSGPGDLAARSPEERQTNEHDDFQWWPDTKFDIRWSTINNIAHAYNPDQAEYFGTMTQNCIRRVEICNKIQALLREEGFDTFSKYLWSIRTEIPYHPVLDGIAKYCFETNLATAVNPEPPATPEPVTIDEESVFKIPATPKPKMTYTLTELLSKAENNPLDLDEIQWINDNWAMVEDVADTHYNISWFFCAGLELQCPSANQVEVLLSWGNRNKEYSDVYCEDNATWIDDADAYGLDADEGHTWDTFDGTAYSEDYLNDHTCCCCDCGCRMWNDDAHYSEYHEENYCENCYPENDNHGSVESYNANVIYTKTAPFFYNGEFHRESDTARIYGVELETEAKNDRCDLIEAIDHFDWMILKDDGSLSSDGLEINTLPFDLAGHKAKFPWSEMLEAAREHAQSTRACGIHVHINRACMSKLTATKLTAFLVHKDNQKFNETIAQRAYYENHYCGVQPSDGTGICQLKKDQGFSRYLAVNEDNAKTIEVRIFAANLRPERVLKNLEFLESLILYCESTSAVYVTSVEQYVAYVASNRKHYRNLWAFMIEKGLLDPVDYPKLGAHKAQKEIKFIPQQLAA